MKWARKLLKSVQENLAENGLVLGLTIAIGVALLSTVVSVVIYTAGGFSRYDLSRPGYEKVRQALNRSSTVKTYDSTSPVNLTAVGNFLKEYDGTVQELAKDGNFNDASLSDEELQISSQAVTNQ